MKFANIAFNARGINNVGDNMQLIAIDNIYKEMGIPLSEVVYIDFHKLKDYDGEYVILPISMPMVDYIEGGISGRFSPRIIPVFLGLNMVRRFLYPEEVSYLKMYEPIGCRDEWCLETMRKYGIKSYLHGCITFTLPERTVTQKQDKIYIVDADETLVDMLPKELFKDKEIIRATHSYKKLDRNPKETAIQQYREYKDNAALVITGLLHCALPCFAAGIPVIMLNTKVSYRKAFLESLLTIWTPERLNIQGGVLPSKLSESQNILKQKILELTKKRILEAYERNSTIYDISLFYEQREKNIYVNDAVLYLLQWVQENWTERNAVYSYSIWGLSQISECLFDFINKNFPNAELVAVYDSFKKVRFAGLETKSPDFIGNEDFVFITATGAAPAAKEIELKLNSEHTTFVYAQVIK